MTTTKSLDSRRQGSESVSIGVEGHKGKRHSLGPEEHASGTVSVCREGWVDEHTHHTTHTPRTQTHHTNTTHAHTTNAVRTPHTHTYTHTPYTPRVYAHAHTISHVCSSPNSHSVPRNVRVRYVISTLAKSYAEKQR